MAGEDKPILAVDVDGVISLFGFEGQPPREAGRFHLIDGMPHLISAKAPACLQRLHRRTTSWSGRPAGRTRRTSTCRCCSACPSCRCCTSAATPSSGPPTGSSGPIGEYAGDRPLAWIDDSLNDECRTWACDREEPTLLVETESMLGIEDAHVDTLIAWVEDGYTPS